MTVKGAFVAVLGFAIMLGGAALAPALAKDADPVVATLDDYEIRLSDVQGARGLLPPQLQGQPMEVVYPLLLDALINSHLASKKAREMGLDDNVEYKKRMARIGDQILERLLLSQHIQEQITDEQVQKRYDELRERAKGIFEVHARHILVKTEDEAMDVIKKLQGGADFATLAQQRSIGPSGPKGGDLGWFGPGRMVRAFEDAALALLPGKFTGYPVQTTFGWHIIKVDERRPLTVASFEDTRPALVNELSAEAGQKFMEQLRVGVKMNKVDWQELQ